MIIPSCPTDIKDCLLYRLLQQKSSSSDGLAEQVERIIQTTKPLLNIIAAGPFKDYTLHNQDHAIKLVHLSGYLMNESVLEQLSALEICVIISSAFLHDLGMCVTNTERNKYLESSAFQDFIRLWPEIMGEMYRIRKELHTVSDDSHRMVLETSLYQLQEVALCSFLRPKHADKDRYSSLIKLIKTTTSRNDLFFINGVSFEEYLIDICVSHNSDVSILTQNLGLYNERFPTDLALGGQRLNMQFCAAILRLTDILDFDRERTPKILFDSLGIASKSLPGSEVSLLEWQKHLAIHTLEFKDDEIVIVADSHHPAIEAAIREFCKAIETELKVTSAVIRKNPQDVVSRYDLNVPNLVRPKIRSIGYVFKDISLRLNQPAIMRLLMGEKLYSRPEVAVRELLQNAVDACSVRAALDDSSYEPKISLSQTIDTDGTQWLEVSDNGIGMDEYVLSNFFFQVGSCYYDSPDFDKMLNQKSKINIATISRFGIGVVSTFMIGNWLEVTTKSKFSPRHDYKTRCLRIESKGGLAFVTESDEPWEGSKIRVRLKLSNDSTDTTQEFWEKVINYIRQTVIRPAFPISITTSYNRLLIAPDNFYSVRDKAVEYLNNKNMELITIDISRWSQYFSGLAYILLLKDENGILTHLRKGGSKNNQYFRIQLGKDIDPHQVITGYEGNRLSVDGFVMKSKMNQLFAGNIKIPLILDIAVKGLKELEYNVSRDKVMGDSTQILRKELHSAINSGLQDLGYTTRLSPETMNIISKNQTHPSAISSDILQRVEKELPKTPWPVGIHKTIASTLGIANSVAHRAITILLNSKVITKPM